MKVSDQIRLYLEEAISKGDLLPGDAIDESALAEQFGVSKTPIREALIQLQAQGWVSNMPRGGSTVAKMNLQQLLSLWELLAELEAVAVRLACERMRRRHAKAVCVARRKPFGGRGRRPARLAKTQLGVS